MKPQRSTDKSGASAVAAELGRKMRTLSIATDLDDGKERTSLQRDTRSSSTVHGTGGQSLEHNGKPAKKGGAGKITQSESPCIMWYKQLFWLNLFSTDDFFVCLLCTKRWLFFARVGVMSVRFCICEPLFRILSLSFEHQVTVAYQE